MKGYSYPGTSPMKGNRKKADLAAAKERKSDAMAQLDEFGDMKMKSTDILGKGSFKVDASPVKSWASTLFKAVGEGAKEGAKGLTKDLVKEGGKAIVGGAVSAGINAIGKKKEKPKKVAADQSGFAGIKFGTK